MNTIQAQTSKADLLRSMKLLRYLDAPELELIAPFLRVRKFLKESTLIHEGSQSRSIYLVKSGKFVVRHTVRGKERELGKFCAGDHFGELSFLDAKPRS